MPANSPFDDPSRPALAPAAVAIRLGAIGAVLACAALLFAYTAGVFSPHRLSPDRMIAAVDLGGGPVPGFRRNHAKGLCAAARFDSNGAAAALSKAALFKPGSVPVVARFSLSGGAAFQADKPSTVRALGLRFLPPGGQEWRTGMIDLPVFPARTAGAFYDLLKDTAPDPATGKPDPAHMKALFAAHPEVLPALKIIGGKTNSSGFADDTYNALHAFHFVNAQGASVPVRWSLVPVQAVVPPPASPPSGDNYLFDDLIAAQARQKLQWRLVLAVGQAGDPTADATLPWPADRQKIDAGTVTIDSLSSEADGSCTAVNYDPLVLPDGIEASDDPLLSARSATYARSFTLRAGETAEKKPSAITPQIVQSGGKS